VLGLDRVEIVFPGEWYPLQDQWTVPSRVLSSPTREDVNRIYLNTNNYNQINYLFSRLPQEAHQKTNKYAPMWDDKNGLKIYN